MKIGILINPVAGVGGAVGLKGSDRQLEEALRRGGSPRSSFCAKVALEQLLPLTDSFSLYCGRGLMGWTCAEELGLNATAAAGKSEMDLAAYSRADTLETCCFFLEQGVDLIAFAGGDGTARDVLDATNGAKPVVAIPSGVKMYSGVFASKPVLAGKLLARWIRGELRKTQGMEVMDLDEALYREGIVSPRLYGYLETPYDTKALQGKKARSLPSEKADQQSIAWDLSDSMDPAALYLIGPGSTTARLGDALEIDSTLIGFDAVAAGKLLAKDLGEREMLDLLSRYPQEKRFLVLTPIGGQGILLGRGNQQASPRVLDEILKENIRVVATKNKLAELGGEPLILDTGDESVNRRLAGYYRIVTGYREYALYKVV